MRFTITMILGLSMMATAEGTCADSTTFFVGGNTNRPCDWVAEKTSVRCVDIAADPDHEAPIYCPVTCDTCPTDSPTTGPTTSPTDAPIGSPTTLTPTDSPTLTPTDSPTNSPTDSPTSSPTVSPTFNPTSTPTTATPTDSPTVSPTPFPSTSPTFYPTLCLDSTTFYFRDNTKRNCEWASNTRYSHARCNKPNDEEGEIRAACPVSCGGCPDEPTSAPVASPTDSSTSSPTKSFSPTSSCVDSSTFYLHTNTRRTCEWASRNINRCSKPVDDNNEVQANCPVACGTCPTSSPSTSLTSSPSSPVSE